jgi:hypothetical protein
MIALDASCSILSHLPQFQATSARFQHFIFGMCAVCWAVVPMYALRVQDGLLLDTETFYTIAQQQVAERYGKQFTWDLKAKMMGKKALDAAQVSVNQDYICCLQDTLTQLAWAPGN